MKTCKRVIALLTLLVILGGLLPMQAFAIDHIDLDRPVSLDMICKYGDMPLANAEFKLYRIADPDEQCNLLPNGKYQTFLQKGGWLENKNGQVQLIDLENKANSAEGEKTWQNLNLKLMDFVRANKVPQDGASFFTDENGVLKIRNVPAGLYLILGEPLVQDKITYEHAPVLVMLPDRFGGEHWVYDRVLSESEEYIIRNKPVMAKNALKVIKKWNDGNDAAGHRPKTLVIYLYCDGELYDTITLPIVDEQGHKKWEYTWETLEYGHTWTVAEEKAGLKEVFYKWSAPKLTYEESEAQGDEEPPLIVWTITNTYSPPRLPQTGQLWWPVPVLLIVGMVFVLAGLIRRRGDHFEA